MKDRVDVVVIGSGIGGLCCAALCARAGREVLVLEAHTQPGGAAHGFQRQEAKDSEKHTQTEARGTT